jgi:hypothetical protein
MSEVNHAAVNKLGSATANRTPREAGQVRAGVSGAPIGDNFSRAQVVGGYKDAGCGSDLVAMFDDAGELPVRQAGGSMRWELSEVPAGEVRVPEKGNHSYDESERNAWFRSNGPDRGLSVSGPLDMNRA